MTSADIAVVGAGIIGCLVARELTTGLPEASIVVLDRDAAGSGASRRSAGLHFPRGSTARVRRLSSYSQDYYTALKAAVPSLPIHPVGMTLVASTSTEQQLREIYLDRAGLTRTHDVPGAQVALPAGARVWTGDGCHYADVGALVTALVGELRPRVCFREGVQVIGVEPTGESVELRLGTGESLIVGAVVLAPGPWLHAPAWRSLVAPLGARVKKVAALHIDVRPRDGDGVIVFHDEDAFLLPLSDRGYWLFSYTCQEWDVHPDEIAEGLSEAVVEDAHRCLATYSPELARLATAGRVFCDAYSSDHEPLVRALDSERRLVFAGAANGSGYRLAPAIAAEVAEILHITSGQRILA